MEIIKFEELENKLIKYNEEFVLVDRDVAQLYGVETREINQAVLNNLDKYITTKVNYFTNTNFNRLVETMNIIPNNSGWSRRSVH